MIALKLAESANGNPRMKGRPSRVTELSPVRI